MLKLKILKGTVFVLTFLLFAGIVLLFGRLVTKKKNSFITGAIVLNEPAGSEIKQISSGGKNLYILVNGGGKSSRVVIFDTETNRIISNISID